MGSRHHLGPTKPALPAALLAAALTLPLAAGCSGGPDEPAGGAKAAPATLTQLAERIGCNPVGQRKVKDLEQGNCKTSDGRYVLVSFTTDKGMNAWLNEAKPWGGTYLVGVRWVVVSKEPELRSLRKNLGGEIVHGARHGSDHGTGHG